MRESAISIAERASTRAVRASLTAIRVSRSVLTRYMAERPTRTTKSVTPSTAM
jgi:hypothetical protein